MRPSLMRPLPVPPWQIPQEQHLALVDAVLTTFRDFGYRYKPRGRSAPPRMQSSLLWSSPG
jgi:hypothetical protein